MNAQAKLFNYGKYMVEDISLNTFIFQPDHRIGKGINFNR